MFTKFLLWLLAPLFKSKAFLDLVSPHILQCVEYSDLTDDEVKRIVQSIDAKKVADLMVDRISIADVATECGKSVKASDVADYMDAESVADHVDCSEVAKALSESDVASEIDLESLASELDYSALASHVPTDKLEIDYSSLAEDVDYSTLASEFDAEDVARHIEASDVAAHIEVDMDALVERVSDEFDYAALAKALIRELAAPRVEVRSSATPFVITDKKEVNG